MRTPRRDVIDPKQVQVVHAHSRTVRQCFLFGDDPLTGNNYDHRKQWIQERLEFMAQFMGMDLLTFAILSNHFHLILRSRPDVVETWSDHEVARRWLTMCPERKDKQGQPIEPSQAEIDQIAACPEKVEELRTRLSSVSWWMRLLCQKIAKRCNLEDGSTGRFFQDRYKATILADEASLLACAAYVDLNPIRAAICENIEDSPHTSIGHRLSGERKRSRERQSAEPKPVERLRRDDFLAPLAIDPLVDPVGPHASTGGKRCSDKGFLSMSLIEYAELLDWTARQRVAGKSGSTPEDAPPLVARLGLSAPAWCEMVEHFGRLFSHVAGHPDRVGTMRGHVNHRRFYLSRRARELFTSG